MRDIEAELDKLYEETWADMEKLLDKPDSYWKNKPDPIPKIRLDEWDYRQVRERQYTKKEGNI